MYYYETFVEQGVTPPTQAVDGLLFAVDLVPQDDDLRLMAVRQLLREGRRGRGEGAVRPDRLQPALSRRRSGAT